MLIDFDKFQDRLVPAVVQDPYTKNILMLGYMNEEAYQKTIDTQLVTFYSRSKKRLWTKGEESKNVLKLIEIILDCDADALLVKAIPQGPTCHKGTDTCWGEANDAGLSFISQLESVINSRKQNLSTESSYVASLFEKGINKIAQKVGEESIELVIEAKDNDPDLFLNEAADLLFHYLILLRAKDVSINEVCKILEERHRTL